jgi:hypothetical protein
MQHAKRLVEFAAPASTQTDDIAETPLWTAQKLYADMSLKIIHTSRYHKYLLEPGD